jgi:hypothetical protein
MLARLEFRDGDRNQTLIEELLQVVALQWIGQCECVKQTVDACFILIVHGRFLPPEWRKYRDWGRKRSKCRSRRVIASNLALSRIQVSLECHLRERPPQHCQHLKTTREALYLGPVFDRLGFRCRSVEKFGQDTGREAEAICLASRYGFGAADSPSTLQAEPWRST